MKSQFLRTMIIIGLFGSSNLLSAWNVLYSSTTSPGKGSSQNICRNVNNNGSVTASVWVHNATPSVANVRFLEVDDKGDLIAQNVFQFKFSTTFVDVPRIEIHRMLINHDNNSYVILGTAHNVGTVKPTTQSFLLKVNTSLNFVDMKFLDEYFDYYDFTITPFTGQIACVGTIGIFDRLKTPSRRAVITTLANNFSCTGINLMPQSFPGSGNISRFDNIKVIKSYFDAAANQEVLFISGHITRDSVIGVSTFYIPQVFASRILIGGSGSLTNQWYSVVDSRKFGYSPVDQVVPCDLIFDMNISSLTVLASSVELGMGNLTKSVLLIFDAMVGNAIRFVQFEGPGLVPGILSVHTVYGQSIVQKSNGKYSIHGWADNYIYPGSVTNRYNFYQVDFNPNTMLFDSMSLVIGNSLAYVGTQPNDFYGLFTDTGYTEGSSFYHLGVYFTPHSLTCYVDSNGIDQDVIVWFSTDNIPNQMNHMMRIWSSVSGQGDGPMLCKPSRLEVTSEDHVLYSDFRIVNWQYVPCIELPQGNHSVTVNDLSKKLCDGSYD
jgi:hypothetical protein